MWRLNDVVVVEAMAKYRLNVPMARDRRNMTTFNGERKWWFLNGWHSYEMSILPEWVHNPNCHFFKIRTSGIFLRDLWGTFCYFYGGSINAWKWRCRIGIKVSTRPRASIMLLGSLRRRPTSLSYVMVVPPFLFPLYRYWYRDSISYRLILHTYGTGTNSELYR